MADVGRESKVTTTRKITMLLAGLAAEGITTVRGLDYLDRGYAGLETKLAAVGASIQRVGSATASSTASSSASSKPDTRVAA